ncbi:hypothetical protein ASG39_05860 [Rhizobium sp. Leaf371]|nr:hypothetical protein ASG39_05860 [Rhizobium sp. Leaf371]
MTSNGRLLPTGTQGPAYPKCRLFGRCGKRAGGSIRAPAWSPTNGSPNAGPKLRPTRATTIDDLRLAPFCFAGPDATAASFLKTLPISERMPAVLTGLSITLRGVARVNDASCAVRPAL